MKNYLKPILIVFALSLTVFTMVSFDIKKEKTSNNEIEFPIPPKLPTVKKTKETEAIWNQFEQEKKIFDEKMKTITPKVRQHLELMNEYREKNIPLTKEMFEMEQKIKTFTENGGLIDGC